MCPKNLPADINAEILLEYYPKETFAVELKGQHMRNTYQDVLELEEAKGRIRMSLARNSIYNSLPEFLFHPIDRFDMPQYNQKERFAEECAKQEQEIENSYKFFAPIDLALLHQRIRVRRETDAFTSENKVLIDIVLDSLSEECKNNRFIRKSYEYIPYCNIIRGDRTLITMMLRKVLMKEDIVIAVNNSNVHYFDRMPRYDTELDSELDSLYLDSGFEQNTLCYNVYYWDDAECDENFSQFISDLEEYRRFVQDWFLAVDALLKFDVYKDTPPLKLSDSTTFNYLNYNTNI